MPTYNIPEINDLPPVGASSCSRRRVVIVLGQCTNSLEYMGPLQVFMEANFFLERAGRSDLGYDLEIVAVEPGIVFEMLGMTITVDRSYDTLSGEIDTIVFQAVDEDERTIRDESFITWVKDVAGRTRRVTSICVGTYVLAEAGLLNGRRATTHWMACDELQRRYPEVRVDPEPIFVKDGHIYTSAGSTAGIDLSIALVEEDFGSGLALRVAQGLVMYLKRPGSQAQFSAQLSTGFSRQSSIREVQTYVVEHLDDDLSVDQLAQRASMSPRNFARVFSQEAGVSPGKFIERTRLERARLHLEQTDTPIGRIARQCGYRTADGMRVAFERNLGINPREYRQRFSKASDILA